MSTAQEPRQRVVTEGAGTQSAIEQTPLEAAIEATPHIVKVGLKGVVIESLNDAHKFASVVFNGGMNPKSLKTVPSIMIALLYGAELGLSPMVSIQNIAVVNGRPSVWGDVMLAMCQSSGVFDHAVFLEGSEEDPEKGHMAYCTVRRLPDGKSVTRSFSMADAKQAKLLDKDTPWKTYPHRMCQMRARSFALRDTFTDVLGGMRATEEEMDIPTETEPEAAPASSLDELTENLKEPEPVAVVSSSGETVMVPNDLVGELTEPALNPPSPEEVAADQPRICEEYSQLIADADRIQRVSALRHGIVDDVANDRITKHQAGQLYELCNGAEERIKKVNP